MTSRQPYSRLSHMTGSTQNPFMQTGMFLLLPLEVRQQIYGELLADGLHFDVATDILRPALSQVSVQVRNEFIEFCRLSIAEGTAPLTAHVENFSTDTNDHPRPTRQFYLRLARLNMNIHHVENEFTVSIFLTDDFVLDSAPIQRLMQSIEWCIRSGVFMPDFEIHFNRLNFDLHAFSKLIEEIRLLEYRNLYCISILDCIEVAMIAAVAEQETAELLSGLPFSDCLIAEV